MCTGWRLQARRYAGTQERVQVRTFGRVRGKLLGFDLMMALAVLSTIYSPRELQPGVVRGVVLVTTAMRTGLLVAVTAADWHKSCKWYIKDTFG